MPTRIKLYDELSDNVKAKAREKALEWQVRPEEVVLALDTDNAGKPTGLKFQRAPSKAYAGTLEAAASIVPTTAGITTGVALAPSTGGLLSFVGGAGAGMAAGKIQDVILRKALPGVARDLDIARQYYPKLTTAAQAAGALAGNKQLLLNKGALLSKAGLDVARNQGARGVAALALREAGGARGLAKNLGIGAGAGVGFEGYQQIQEGRFSPERLLTAGVANALVGGGAPRSGTLVGANLLRRGFGKAPISRDYTVAARPVEQPAADNWKELSDFTAAYKAETDPVKQKAIWDSYSARHPEWSSPEAVINTGEQVIKRDEAVQKAREKAEEKAKKEAEKAAVEEKKKGIGLDFDPKKLVDQTVDETSRIVKAFGGKLYDGVKIDRSVVEAATPEVKAKMLVEAARIEAENAAAEAAAKQQKDAERKAKQAAEQAKKPTKAEQKMAELNKMLEQTGLPTTPESPTTKPAETPASKLATEKLDEIEQGIKRGSERLAELAMNPNADEAELVKLSKGLGELEKLYVEGGGSGETLFKYRTKFWPKGAKTGPPISEHGRYVQRTKLTDKQVETFDAIGRSEWLKDEQSQGKIDPDEWNNARGEAFVRVSLDPHGLDPTAIKRAWNTARKAAFLQRQGEVRLPEGEAGDAFLARAAGEGQPVRTGELEEGNIPGTAVAAEAGTGLKPVEVPAEPVTPPSTEVSPPKPAKKKASAKPVESKTGQVFKPGELVTLKTNYGDRQVEIVKVYKHTAQVKEIDPAYAKAEPSSVQLSKLSKEPPKVVESAAVSDELVKKFAEDPDGIDKVAGMTRLPADVRADIIQRIYKYREAKRRESTPSPEPPPITSEAPPAKTTKTGQKFKPGSQALGVIPQPPEWAKRAAIATGKAIGKTERTIKNIAKDFKRSWDAGEGLTADAGHLVGKAGSPEDVLNADATYRDLKSKLHPDELELLNDAGFEKFMKGQKTRAEIGEWLEANGPKVEVWIAESDPMSLSGANEKRQRYFELIHDLDTTFGANWQEADRAVLLRKSPGAKATLEEYDNLASMFRLPQNANRPNWQFVAPKPESEMPGYAEIAVTVPVEVRRWTDPQGNRMAVENKKFPSTHYFPDNTLGWVRGYMETLPSEKKAFRVIEVQSDWASQVKNRTESQKIMYEGNDHPLLKQYNRLALKAAIDHAKKNGADAVIVDDAETAMLTERHDQAASMVKRSSIVELADDARRRALSLDHRPPLSEIYGGDWRSGIYAKVTNYGRDSFFRIDKPEHNFTDPGKEFAIELARLYGNGKTLPAEGETPFIQQERGMRFNYDPDYRVFGKNTGEELSGDFAPSGFPTAEDAQAWARANRVRDFNIVRGQLHRLMTELTGYEGTPGRFGEHKDTVSEANLLNVQVDYPTEAAAHQHMAELGVPSNGYKVRPFEKRDGTIVYDVTANVIPRKNLIFTDLETGQPKTTSTGRIYHLDRLESAPSLFNPDKVTPAPTDHRGNLYSNPFGVLWTEGVKATGRALDMIDRWAFRPWMGGELEKARSLPSNPTEKDKARATAAEALRDAKSDFDREFVKLNNQFARTIDESLKGETFTDAEVRRVTQHADYLQDLGASPMALTPKEQKLFDAFEKTKLETGGERTVNGPLVDGREFRVDPNWSMHAIMDKDVRDVLNHNKEGADKYRNDYIDWYLVNKPDSTREEASAFLDEILGKGETKSSGTGPTAATMRKSEGIGLPPSMREKSIISRMRWNAHITAADLAWHRNVERNGKVAVMLGLTDDARGNEYPKGLDAYSNPATAADYMLPDVGYGKHLSVNRRGERWVEAAVGEMEAPRRAHSDNIEKWTSVANSMNLGTWTAARDVAGSFGILSGWLKPSEYGAALKAFRNLLEGKTQGALKGQVRGKRTAEFYAQEDAYRGLALKAADIMRKYQGRDLIEKGLREFIAEIGNAIAPKRVAGALAGDAADVRFMNEMGGKNWRAQLNDPAARQKLMDRVGQRFVDTVQGNYSIDYLPAWLSRHEKGLLKATLTLSRWSFERARRFKNEIVTPMIESGDIKPLLKQSLGYAIGGAGIDALSDLLLSRKPKEMTWKEFFGLTSEEKINEFSHMLAGKAAIMGMGGMFAQLADYGQQLKHGEGNYPLQNPALRLSGDLVHKVAAYLSAYGGPLDGTFWSNILSLPYETLMDEVQLPRMIRQAVRGQQDTGTREEQMLKRVSGLTKPSLRTIQDIDPFSPVGKVKRARTPEEIQSLTGTLYDYYSRNKQLRPSAIPGVLEKRAKAGYYDFVNRIQGRQAAAKAVERDKNQEALARLKRAAVARAWYGAERDRRSTSQ